MKFVVYADSGGNYGWRLVASNGQTVATSGESSASKGNARRAAEGVKAGAGSAAITEAWLAGACLSEITPRAGVGDRSYSSDEQPSWPRILHPRRCSSHRPR